MGGVVMGWAVMGGAVTGVIPNTRQFPIRSIVGSWITVLRPPATSSRNDTYRYLIGHK